MTERRGTMNNYQIDVIIFPSPDYPVTSCRSAVIREQNVSTRTSRWLDVLFVWICYQFVLVLQLPTALPLSSMLIKPNMPQMRTYLSTRLNKFAQSGQTTSGRAERKIEDFYRAQHSTTNFYYLGNARSPFASVPIPYYHLWLYRSRRQSTNRTVGKHRRPAKYFIEFLSAAESGALAFRQMNLRSFNEETSDAYCRIVKVEVPRRIVVHVQDTNGFFEPTTWQASKDNKRSISLSFSVELRLLLTLQEIVKNHRKCRKPKCSWLKNGAKPETSLQSRKCSWTWTVLVEWRLGIPKKSLWKWWRLRGEKIKQNNRKSVFHTPFLGRLRPSLVSYSVWVCGWNSKDRSRRPLSQTSASASRFLV